MSLTKTVNMDSLIPKDSETELEQSFRNHLNMINASSYWEKPEVEEILLRQHQYQIWRMDKDNKYKTPEGIPRFTPSGASKSKRELFYRSLRVKPDESTTQPYHQRWTRNSTAIHDAIQKDLLYADSLLDNPLFSVNMIDKGEFGLLPAWEKNLENYKTYNHNGQEFVVSGMMDGILTHNKDGKSIGFEYKTKSNDAWQVHNMKNPATYHVSQCVAYSLIFENEEGKPLTDYLLTYEAVPKDKWTAGVTALRDIKAFHIKVTERQRKNMLDRFADVVQHVQNGELPKAEPSRCFFCQYKTRCNGGC